MVLHICEKFHKKISEKVFNLQSGLKYMVKMAMFNVERAVTPKIGKSEIGFMSSARRLMEL